MRNIDRRPKVKATAEHLGGTVVRYTCEKGHVWTEDLGRASLPRAKRLGETAVAMMARWWRKGGNNGVTIVCTQCNREAERQAQQDREEKDSTRRASQAASRARLAARTKP